MKREIAADGRVTFVEYVRSIGRKEYVQTASKRFIQSPFFRKLLMQMLMCEQIRFL